MRILLLQPPVQDFYQTPIRTYPLGLTSLAGVLLEEGFEVEILDAHDPKKRQTIPLPKAFSYIRKYYSLNNKSPFKLFDHYYHFGLTLGEITAEVGRRKPDMVGISALFSPYSHIAIDIARHIKRLDKTIITVMGGAHAWSMPHQVLGSGVIDFIIRGEAEWSFLHLCRQLKSKSPDAKNMAAIPGIGFRNGLSPYLHPGYAFIEKLDELPMPARDLVDNARYVIDGRRYTMLLTSRGCPHACGFCALSATPCATYRVRPPEKVLTEIAHCRQHYGITHFDIEDDNFTADRRHAATILDGVTAMADVSLSAMNGLSACNLTPPLLDAMQLAGFSHLDLALVTNNPDSRKLVTRPGSLSQFGDILREAGRRQFKTTVHIILGLPEDTTANMIQTLAYLMTQPCLIGANIYYPVPGSTLFTQYQEHIRYQSPPFWRSTLASCESYPGQRDEYMTLFYLARVINYVKRLLTRLDRTDSRLPLQEVSGLLFRELVPAATRALIAENEISQARRWTADTLGIFMLQRFCDTRRLEKVQVRKENAGIIYSFTDEFNCREVLEQFWAKAVSTPLAAG